MRIVVGFVVLLMVECYMVFASRAASIHQKEESEIPIPTNSPPEGNTTFVGGMAYCVALPSASNVDLQNALNWACGLGGADCSLIQPGAPCFEPNTLLSHASYAFNMYYQENGNNAVACNFGGTATTVSRNPSYGSCQYVVNEQKSASSVIHPATAVKNLGFFLLLYFAAF